jgi:hypothetical protein
MRNPSMWHDEAALVVNVLDKRFDECFGPLYLSEAAPPLFLWLEKLVVCCLGEGTYALRLLPFLASCASLGGVALAARRLLPPAAAFWLVLLFGCSDRLLWHGCEAKPYAVDVLLGTGLMLAFLGLQPGAPLGRRLVLLGGCTPVLLFLSYPACFLLGGVALGLLPAVYRSARRSLWLLYGLFLAVLAGSFLLLLAGPIHAQRDERLLECWQDMFPDWQRPAHVPLWWGKRFVEVFRYACEPTGNALAVCAAVGTVLLWRQGRRRLVVFLLAPVLLPGLATLAGQYPFGATRVMVYTAPAVLLLTAAGLPAVFALCRRMGHGCTAVLVCVLMFPAAQAVYRLFDPWERADSAGAAAFVHQRRQADEPVRGTLWEHNYYFRDLGSWYRPVIGPPAEPLGPERRPGVRPERLWLLAAGRYAHERRAALEAFRSTADWSVLEQHEFAQTTVFYLSQPRPSP